MNKVLFKKKFLEKVLAKEILEREEELRDEGFALALVEMYLFVESSGGDVIRAESDLFEVASNVGYVMTDFITCDLEQNERAVLNLIFGIKGI